jgi:hypothetical protein
MRSRWAPASRAAQHGAVAVPHLAAQLPGGVVVVGGQRPQDRLEVVLENDVDQRVEGILAPFGGDVLDHTALQALVGLREGVADLEAGEGGQPGQRPGLGGGQLGEQVANPALGQVLLLLIEGQAHDVLPARQQPQAAVGAKALGHAGQGGHGECDDGMALLGGASADLQLVQVLVGLAGVDGEHVPVEGPLAHPGHLEDVVLLLLGVAVETAVHDELERGALVLRDDGGQREHLVAVGEARRHRHAVAVGVGEGQRRGEAHPAGLDRAAQQLGPSPRSPRLWPRAGHRRRRRTGAAPSGPTRNPGVDRHGTVEAVEEIAEALPSPVEAQLEGLEGHALHLGHHASHIIAVAGLQRGEGEAAVAADDRGHAVQVGRRGCGIPVQLGVVMGVGIDEPRGQHQPGAVHLAVTGFADLTDGADAPVGHRNVGRPGLVARSVDDERSSNHQVCHQPFLRDRKSDASSDSGTVTADDPARCPMGWPDGEGDVPSWRRSPGVEGDFTGRDRCE